MPPTLKRLTVAVKSDVAVVKSVQSLSKRLGLSLPTEDNIPPENLGDYTILLYGAKKIGKTSVAARFPKAMFLSLEPGTKALAVRARPVKNWEEFCGYVELLEEENEFETIVVDTIDLLYEYASDFICRKKKINHPSEENDYGATWKEISQLFRDVVLRLINIGKGLIFISHDIEKEIELRDGTKIDRVQPTMSKQAMSVVEALVDIIMNYSYEEDRRILRIDGTQSMVAGCRVETHFVRKGGAPRTAGDRIMNIDMGRTAEEAYTNLLSAFANEQELTDVTAVKKTTKPLKATKKLSLATEEAS